MNEFIVEEKIGDGQSSSTFRVVRKLDSQTYFLKKVILLIWTRID